MPGGGLEFACEKPKEHVEDLEHVMKTLQSLESTDDKLSALCRKYAELLEEHRTMQNTLKQTQRTLSVLAREKDQLQNDHSKAVLAKNKLEGLCRELQRHNRLVKDESAARAKEDDEKRKEIAAKFQTTINDIQQQMNDHYQKNSALREENMELTNKLKGLIEQYELREEHIDKVLKHKDLETQLYDAKLAQATLQVTEEKERNLQEKQQLLEEALENQKRVVLLTESEKGLKAQVAMYQEKYDEFQQTLTKSNDVFLTFKNEMDKMTKKIKKLEKETAMYRQRWEGSNKALLTMAEEKTRSEREVSVLQNKVAKLESLCRALQEERKKNITGRIFADPRALSVEKSLSPPPRTTCEEAGCQHHHETVQSASLPSHATAESTNFPGDHGTETKFEHDNTSTPSSLPHDDADEGDNMRPKDEREEQDVKDEETDKVKVGAESLSSSPAIIEDKTASAVTSSYSTPEDSTASSPVVTESMATESPSSHESVAEAEVAPAPPADAGAAITDSVSPSSE